MNANISTHVSNQIDDFFINLLYYFISAAKLKIIRLTFSQKNTNVKGDKINQFNKIATLLKAI
jgi:hypothetical protein